MQTPIHGPYHGTYSITTHQPTEQPTHLVLHLHGVDGQKENSGDQNANNTTGENQQRSYAQTYWENVANTTVVLDKILEEIRNTRKAHVVNLTARLAEGVGYTAVGTMNALGNGDLYGGATNIMLGVYNLALGAYGAKAVYDGAMESNTLSKSLEEIQQGISMMKQLNEANIEDANQLADYLASVEKKLKEEKAALGQIKLDLLKQAHNKDLEMMSLQAKTESNIERLSNIHKLLSDAIVQNTSGTELIEQGLATLEKTTEALQSESLSQEDIKLYINDLKAAADDFIKGVRLTKGASSDMHKSMADVNEMCGELMKDNRHAMRDLAHEKKLKLEMAERLEAIENDKQKMLIENKKAAHDVRNMQKRMFKQQIIAQKASQSVQNAKQRQQNSETEWGVVEYLSGAALGFGTGVAGLFTGGVFGMFGGAITGFKVAGSSVHELRKKSEAAKKAFVASVPVTDPTPMNPVQIKFAPSTTCLNWMPYTEAWKDSETMGGFKVQIGSEVYEGTFNTKTAGAGSLSFEEELKLYFALSDALADGKITGAECRRVLQTLDHVFTVQCERTEGKLKNVAVRLIDLNSELFLDLTRRVDEISQHNMENSLLMSTVFSSGFEGNM
ncbi:hypothetical protein [Estrella lausannensis]|uniref:Uncharacterized protein n=1 Tax=Estrella lausannensis TaxID=483423 RepID=A0A0H5DPS5_9BACT|nr:hypothetical protein [Estrella lausannensis]CRX38477.1 hypothetical protein ELAC_1134 [Estrella lausannensis]